MAGWLCVYVSMRIANVFGEMLAEWERERAGERKKGPEIHINDHENKKIKCIQK